jgi:acetyl-CoA carboxylase, biotin carboxylase subunit
VFEKILIANRGEIAVRILRACQEMAVRTVSVYSESDRDALHVRLADEAVCIGPSAPSESYLNVPRIMSAAEITGCDAIHPGYGFLSERAHFAEICESHGVTFIGPSSESIRLMGDKAKAREVMKSAGVPVVPGSDGPVATVEEALAVAAKIGYPLMIKAVAGGGGKGMRIARDEESLRNGYLVAQAEAEAVFGSGAVYLERLIDRPRHIEFQLLGDRHGNVIHLFERECSIQRRHQKLLEESPAIGVDPAVKRRMGEVAVRGAREIGYHSAGTMEFLVDQTQHFYFMEMNTRIQVEHPVTEELTGVDLIKAQIAVAAGEPLGIRQEDVKSSGHAIECRINAEDPNRDFQPSPGLITYFHSPGGPGLRVESHVYTGYRVPPYYDSMIIKIIAHGVDRTEAIRRMRRALNECVVEGIATTMPFHLQVLDDPAFQKGETHTGFIPEMLDRIQARTAAGAPAGEAVVEPKTPPETAGEPDEGTPAEPQELES